MSPVIGAEDPAWGDKVGREQPCVAGKALLMCQLYITALAVRCGCADQRTWWIMVSMLSNCYYY